MFLNTPESERIFPTTVMMRYTTHMKVNGHNMMSCLTLLKEHLTLNYRNTQYIEITSIQRVFEANGLSYGIHTFSPLKSGQPL